MIQCSVIFFVWIRSASGVLSCQSYLRNGKLVAVVSWTHYIFFSPTHLELKLVLIIYTRHSKKLSMKYEGKHLSSFSQDDEIALQRWNRSLFGVTSSLTRDVSAVAPTIKLSGILWTLTENKNWTNEIIKEAHSLKVFRMDFFQMVRFLSDGQSRDDLHWGDHVMIRGFVSLMF